MSTDGARLFSGVVTHRRVRPRRHALRYRVFSVLVDLDDLSRIGRRLRLLSVNRSNVFSIFERDHGHDSAAGLKADIDRMIAEAGLDPASLRTQMLCFPRVLGYAFNPLTVYFCRDRRDRVRLVLYQVNNTFGGRQFYVLPVEGAGTIIRQSCEKRFYVSPFNAVEGRYRFRVRPPADDLAFGIGLDVDERTVLTACYVARAEALTDKALVKAFLRMPLMTFKVIAGIHYEALKLWLKGLTLTKRPETARAFAVHVGDSARHDAAHATVGRMPAARADPNPAVIR